MLGTLDPAQKPKWSQHISQLVHAYNSTRNDATGYSPYFLMFGREARLPVDLCFGICSDEEDGLEHHQYVANMRKELRNAYQLAADAASKNPEWNKKLYDARVRNQTLEKGERVLVRNRGITGKHKLQDRWNSLPYIVIAKLPNLPVYRVKPERGTGIVKTIHRDHLLPIGYLVRMTAQSERTAQPKKPMTSAQRARCDNVNRTHNSGQVNQDDETSESEEKGIYYLPLLALGARTASQSNETEQMDAPVPYDEPVSAYSSVHDLTEAKEQTDELLAAAEQMGESSQSHRDSVLDTELEEGDVT